VFVLPGVGRNEDGAVHLVESERRELTPKFWEMNYRGSNVHVEPCWLRNTVIACCVGCAKESESRGRSGEESIARLDLSGLD